MKKPLREKTVLAVCLELPGPKGDVANADRLLRIWDRFWRNYAGKKFIVRISEVK